MTQFFISLLSDLALFGFLWSYFPDFWIWWAPGVLVIPGSLLSRFLALKGVRWELDLILQAAWPLVLRLGIFLTWQFMAGSEPTDIDTWYFTLDKHFWPLFPLGVIFSLSQGLQLRYNADSWMVLVRGLMLGGIFWAQGDFLNPTFPHPVWKALALGGFLGLQLLVLARPLKAEDPVLRTLLPKTGDRKKTLSRTLMTLALILPLAGGLLWVLFTRYEEQSVSSGGGLMKPDLLNFDFSQFINLESDISMQDNLVLLYRREGPASLQYVRRYLLSGYTPEKGFFVKPPVLQGDEDIPPIGTQALNLAGPGPQDRSEAQQEYYIINFDPSSLLALNAPINVVPFEKWDRSSFVGSYKVTSLVPGTGGWELEDREAKTLDPDLRKHYTDFGSQNQVKDLAQEITSLSPGYYHKIWDILFYLKNNYYYSLHPGVAADGDQLGHFLFNSKKGYCSYFAFAMTLMLRSLDIPSRVAVGFLIDPSVSQLNFYPVRANQAHAWVEVWFDGVGWVEFDPTSEEMAQGEDYAPPRGLDPEELSRLIQEILNHTLRSPAPGESPEQNPPEPWYQSLGRTVGAWLWVLLPGLWVLAAGMLHLIPPMKLALARGNPRKQALWAYSRGLGVLSLKGHKRLPRQTPQEFAAHLQNPGWTLVSDLHVKALYSPEFTGEEARLALDSAQTLVREEYRKIPPWKKVFHLLYPWTHLKGGRRGHLR